MTHDEMIEQTARALAGPLHDEMVLAGNPIGEPVEYPRWMLFQQDARAAIRVIAPAVLDEVDRELAMTCLANSEAPSEWIDGFEAAGQRVRALKTRYEQ